MRSSGRGNQEAESLRASETKSKKLRWMRNCIREEEKALAVLR